MSQGKLRVIKDFEKLDLSVQKMIKEAYPFGFADDLITISNKDGALIRALPFETDDKYYLVKMPVNNSKMVDDEDFDDEVVVKESKKPDLGKDFDDVADEEYDEDDQDED